jgi:para-nitrobenzyl esterase
MAPQPPAVEGFAIPGDPEEQSEDCLNLNIWTPGLDNVRRPVMVWIHGGSFISGTGAGLIYRGDDLTTGGDVVVVTINYRLGALGFLAHPSLVADTPEIEAIGNWGLLDQVAALSWVRTHIQDFGGDPDNVTVFGESAGGMSVSALLGAPSARNLFRRAIIQSGPAYSLPLARASETAEEVGRQLALPGLDRAALESIPAVELVAAVGAVQARLPAPGEIALSLLPVVDGHFLPDPPEVAVRRGDAAGVELMIGTTRDEMSMFALGSPEFSHIDNEGLVRWIRHAAPGADADLAIDCYRSARKGRGESTGNRDLWVAMGTDVVFRWPTLRLAAAHREHQPRTFVYLFTHETPAFGGILGSCHALEIPFVFGSVRHPAVAMFSGGGSEAESLSRRMQDAWTGFARNGEPSDGGVGPWPPWDPADRATMLFGPDGGVERAPRNEELESWESYAPLDSLGRL